MTIQVWDDRKIFLSTRKSNYVQTFLSFADLIFVIESHILCPIVFEVSFHKFHWSNFIFAVNSWYCIATYYRATSMTRVSISKISNSGNKRSEKSVPYIFKSITYLCIDPRSFNFLYVWTLRPHQHLRHWGPCTFCKQWARLTMT